VKHHLTTYRLDALELGYDAAHVHFCWRPFEKRSLQAQHAYRLLAEDLEKRGPLHPIITKDGHVLIGQRRVEILRRLGYTTVDAVEIDEDLDTWTGADLPRLEEFKRLLYGPGVVEAWLT